MNIVSRPNHYQERAIATRKRRQAKGLYQKPSKAQDAAFRRYIGNGKMFLEPGDAALLAQHPWLNERQRQAFAVMAAAEGKGE